MDQQSILNAIDTLNRVISNHKTSEEVLTKALEKVAEYIAKLQV